MAISQTAYTLSCRARAYKGMVTWMQVQVREAKVHAGIFLNYILERGEMVELESIQKPPLFN